MPRRLKSNSKDGQSLKSRADESKGKRKKELDKLSKVDKANYKKAPEYIQQEIKSSYKKNRKTKRKVKNSGEYI